MPTSGAKSAENRRIGARGSPGVETATLGKVAAPETCCHIPGDIGFLNARGEMECFFSSR